MLTYLKLINPFFPMRLPPMFRFIHATCTTIITMILIMIFLLPASPAMAASVEELYAQPPVIDIHDLNRPSGESSYWIWLVLPRLFPEYLPSTGGYLSFGFPWPDGEETPDGIQKTVANQWWAESTQKLDCVSCHAATKHVLDPDKTTIAAQFSHNNYARFLVNCASDPRFDPDYMLNTIKYNHHLGFLGELRYRKILIPQAKKAFLDMKAWIQD
jgi:hypothetical protein